MIFDKIWKYQKNSNVKTIIRLYDLRPDLLINIIKINIQQSGKNKRLLKFLLRRGANINATNLAGNTCLHYLYEYKNEEMAKYFLRKGADDTLINADGLTCYKGTNVKYNDNLWHTIVN